MKTQLLRLWHIEWIKVWQSRSNRIMLIGYFALLLLLSAMAMIKYNFGQFVFQPATQGAFDFPYIWHLMTYVAAKLKLVFALVVIGQICNEISYNTLKQNLIDGFTPQAFLGSKMLFIAVLTIASTCVVGVLTLGLGFVFSTFTQAHVVLKDVGFLAAYALKLFTFFSFCVFLSLLLRRSLLVLSFIAFWAVAEPIVYFILKISLGSKAVATSTYNLMPLEAMSRLIEEPFTRFPVIQNMGKALGNTFQVSYQVPADAIWACMVWIVLFWGLSLRMIQKRDW